MKQSRKSEIKGNVKGKKNRGGQKHPGNSTFGPQSPAEAHHQAAARSRAEYQPVVNSIKADNRASAQRQKDISGWYGQLGDQINQAATSTDASYGAANAAMKANIEAATQAAQNANAGVAGQNADFAKLTGADPTAFAPTTTEATNAAAQRSLTQAALAAPIAQAGASQAGYLRTTGINARHEGIYQRGQESKRQQKIKQDLLSARKERSQKTEANFADIGQAERDRALERWKVNKAFPLEQQAASADAANTAFDNNIAQQNANTAKQNANTSQYNAHHPESGEGGGRTPSELRDAKEGRRNALQRAREFIRSHGFPEGPEAHAELVEKIEEGEGIGPREARWAIARLEKKNKGGNRGIPGTTKTPYAPK